MAKTVTVPAPITLRDSITGRPGQTLTFREYAYGHWLTAQQWSNPLTNIDIFLKVKKEIDKPEGETMSFEDADWKFLVDVVKTAQHEPPLVYIQIKGFDDAILDAK